MLVAVAVVVAATPTAAVASEGTGTAARSGSPLGTYDAAGNPVLRDGSPIEGVTFVRAEDAQRVRKSQQAASAARLKTVGNLQCLDGWTTIAGGGVNVNWRVNPDTGYVSANGNPAVDRWNQLFLPCWVPYRDWPVHEWVFLANANGRVVSFVRDHENPINTRLSPTSPVADLEAGARFNHCSYDGNWYYLRIEGSPVLHVKQEFGALYAMGGPLNGDKLLRVTPTINANTRCYRQ
jgi:hypothetical protein